MLVDACLAKDRAARPSAHEIVGRLAAIREKALTRPVPALSLLRRPAVLVLGAPSSYSRSRLGGWMWWNANSRVRWVRNVAIPEIERFMARDDNDGAFRVAREAIAILPDDPYLKQLWIDTTFVVTFESEPSGAEVSVKGYLAHDAEWIPLGRTPLENVRVPYAHVRTRLTKPGFTPLEASLSSFKVKYTLDPEGATPAGMVRAQAGTASVGGTVLPVDDFWIDRLEVTNQEFKTFVDRGGYEKPDYWKEPFVENGRHAHIRRGDGAVPRRDGSRRSVDVGARHLPGGSGQPSGHGRELVRGGRLRRVRRQSAADGLPLDACGRSSRRVHRKFLGDPLRQQLRRQGPGARGHASRSQCRRHLRHGRQRQGMDRQRRR